MKYFILLVGALLLLAGCYQTPTDVAQATVTDNNNVEVTENAVVRYINQSTSSFEFEGYAPGKSHVGTFEDWEGTLFFRDNEIVGLEGTIQAKSVKSDGERLENDLRSARFFDTESYPIIRFVSNSIENDIMTGTLTFKGVTKQLSFPVNKTADSVSAEFLLDVTEFNFDYAPLDDNVRIAFTFQR